MFKTGDTVRIVANTNDHGYEIGSVVTLREEHALSSEIFHGGGSGSRPWLRICDIELVSRQGKTGFARFVRNAG